MKAPLCILAAAFLCGCKTPEYSNSIAGELKEQKLIADYAYAYGHWEAMAEQRPELRTRTWSQADMEAGAEKIFWQMRTNPGSILPPVNK